ncbi:MAG: transposase [Verrucomicrobia bacterium]|nr:transposase [Verrucomicrobiota bacterium]
MPLKIPIEYAGAAYHVMAGGNQGRNIYADDPNRKLWLATLGEACEKTGWRIHARVMMTNHYHLLLETPEAKLEAGMKWFFHRGMHLRPGGPSRIDLAWQVRRRFRMISPVAGSVPATLVLTIDKTTPSS